MILHVHIDARRERMVNVLIIHVLCEEIFMLMIVSKFRLERIV